MLCLSFQEVESPLVHYLLSIGQNAVNAGIPGLDSLLLPVSAATRLCCCPSLLLPASAARLCYCRSLLPVSAAGLI
jgi:hypothetical protein